MSTTRSRNVVVIRFDDSDRTYRALSQLKKADADGLIDVHAAVIVERNADGSLDVADGTDHQIGEGITKGSLIGLLVGILGGPFGLLLGWGAGALIGGAIDADKASETDAVIGAFTKTVPPGRNALITDVTETRESVIDTDAAADGGTVTRRPAHEVLDEIEAAAAAAEAAQDAASAKLRAEKRAERREEFHERWGRIRHGVHL
ncbi:histidine kinase [Streptomyces antibioticus]